MTDPVGVLKEFEYICSHSTFKFELETIQYYSKLNSSPPIARDSIIDSLFQYDVEHDPEEEKTLTDWLQCYYKEGMQNLVDRNGRTIWFSGPAGPMKPANAKSRGAAKRTAKKQKDHEYTKKTEKGTPKRPRKSAKTETESPEESHTPVKPANSKSRRGAKRTAKKQKDSENGTDTKKTEKGTPKRPRKSAKTEETESPEVSHKKRRAARSSRRKE